MNTLVSIVIPIYKVEKYLDICLQSIKNQTYTNWEAICVDDGSPDSCPKIIDEYAAADPRFVAVHKANGGLSDARNAGMAVAKGEYLLFVDSDDFIHPQTLEICVSQALRDNSDIVAFTYHRGFRTRLRIRHFLGLPDIKKPRFKHYSLDKIETVTTDNIYDYITENAHEKLPGVDYRFRVKHNQVWRCLYRFDIVKDIPFIKGIQYEDFPWWGEVLLHIHRATINNLSLYYYYPSTASFLLTASQAAKIPHLQKSLAAAKVVYENAGTEYQKRVWQERFVAPFEAMLERKIRRFGQKG